MSEPFTALVVEETDGKRVCEFRELGLADLPDYDTLVEVDYSSLNYKDGPNISGAQRIARRTPLTAGADLAGTIVESTQIRSGSLAPRSLSTVGACLRRSPAATAGSSGSRAGG